MPLALNDDASAVGCNRSDQRQGSGKQDLDNFCVAPSLFESLRIRILQFNSVIRIHCWKLLLSEAVQLVYGELCKVLDVFLKSRRLGVLMLCFRL